MYQKKVIELWSALARSLYNLQKSFFHSRKDQAFSFRMSPFLWNLKMFHVSTETIMRRMITTSCYIDRQLTFVWWRYYMIWVIFKNYKHFARARACLKFRALNLFLWRQLTNNSVILFNVFSLVDVSKVIFSSKHRLHDRQPAEYAGTH